MTKVNTHLVKAYDGEKTCNGTPRKKVYVYRGETNHLAREAKSQALKDFNKDKSQRIKENVIKPYKERKVKIEYYRTLGGNFITYSHDAEISLMWDEIKNARKAGLI